MGLIKQLQAVAGQLVSDWNTGYIAGTILRQAPPFLSKLLLATLQSQGDPQVVYPLMQGNLEKLDDNFAWVLRNWATATLPKVEPRQVLLLITDAIKDFSFLISNFPQGNRANNLEIAITGYEIATTIFNRQAFPETWATIQNDLGEVYRHRIQGKRAENLEVAIRCHLAALEVRNPQTLPIGWASSQTNLGNSYLERIWGERAENLEYAITCYKAALQVYTAQTHPEAWAIVQNNLGNVYRNRIRGGRAENLEYAITCYKAALQVCNRQTFSKIWATVQNNLGNTYYHRVLGEKAKNLEAAIRCYEAALEVRTRQAFPKDWATTQNNLGNAYLACNNYKAAICCYEAALEVRTCQAFPKDWATTQNNLGLAYSLKRLIGERVGNREAANPYYKNALEVRTRQAFPEDHIKTQAGLGFTYLANRQFHKAYTAFAAAIDTVESLRGEIVFGSGIEEDKQKLAEQWNMLYQCMVEVCLELGDYDQAIEYVERSKARNLIEIILNRDLHSIFPPEIADQLQQLHNEITKVQCRLQTSTGDDPTALVQQLQLLRQQRNKLQDDYLPIGYGFKFDRFWATLDERTAIIEWYITDSGFHTFIITRHSPQPVVLSYTEDDLKDLVDRVIDYQMRYYSQKNEWRILLAMQLELLAMTLHLDEVLSQLPQECDLLILIPHLYLHLLPLHALPIEDELKWGQWKLCLLDHFPGGVRYAPSCQLLQLVQKQLRPNFTHLFAVQNPTENLNYADIEITAIKNYFDSDTVDILKEKDATKATIHNKHLNAFNCIHFSSHGYFNLYNPTKSGLILADAPLKPVPDELDPEEHLMFLPSFGVFDIKRLTRIKSLLEAGMYKKSLIQDNLQELPPLSHAHLDRVKSLLENEAFKERLIQTDLQELLHLFVVEGAKVFDLDKCLTLDSIFSLKLEQCRLVTLSACETGLIDSTNISDEYIGLPSGFLIAGSPAVVSSLWTVNELSTAFLMIKFYENLQNQQISLAVALNQAQLWLRDVTKEELLLWINSLSISSPQKRLLKAQFLKGKFQYLSPSDKPFEEPYYWTAFCAIGQ